MKRLIGTEAGIGPASHATDFRAHGQLIAALPDAMRCEPITPEAIEDDDTLTDEQKAMVYDSLFEWHGDDDDSDDQ